MDDLTTLAVRNRVQDELEAVATQAMLGYMLKNLGLCLASAKDIHWEITLKFIDHDPIPTPQKRNKFRNDIGA